MTDVPGVLRDKDDPATKFAALTIRRCKELEEEGVIAGGMIPKAREGGPVCTEGLVRRVQGAGGGGRDRGRRRGPQGLPHGGALAWVEPAWGGQASSCGQGCHEWAALCSPCRRLPPARPPAAPQVECCIRCLSQGVSATHIIDGRQPHSLLMELLTDEGVGTMITG